MTCTRDDSTPCDCPSCEAAEDAFWREQEGEPDPDMPPDFDLGDLDDVAPLPPAPSPDQLKRETDALLESERERRLDREARDRRDGPILDAYDRLRVGGALASDAAPAPRHPPKLTVVGAQRSRAKRRR